MLNQEECADGVIHVIPSQKCREMVAESERESYLRHRASEGEGDNLRRGCRIETESRSETSEPRERKKKRNDDDDD